MGIGENLRIVNNLEFWIYKLLAIKQIRDYWVRWRLKEMIALSLRPKLAVVPRKAATKRKVFSWRRPSGCEDGMVGSRHHMMLCDLCDPDVFYIVFQRCVCGAIVLVPVLLGVCRNHDRMVWIRSVTEYSFRKEPVAGTIASLQNHVYPFARSHLHETCYDYKILQVFQCLPPLQDKGFCLLKVQKGPHLQWDTHDGNCLEFSKMLSHSNSIE